MCNCKLQEEVKLTKSVKRRRCVFNDRFERLKNRLYGYKLYLELEREVEKMKNPNFDDFYHLFAIEELSLILEKRNFCELGHYLQRLWNDQYVLLLPVWLFDVIFDRAEEVGIKLNTWMDIYEAGKKLGAIGF
ncbi:MAG: hypothetical protein AB1465_06540 [Patescibacteria group bacterium]